MLKGLRNRRSGFARALAALALLALMLRAAVPAGYMLAPVPQAGGAVAEIVLCSGHGPELTLVDDRGHILGKASDKPQKAPAGDKSDAPCAFAAAASLAPPQVQTALNTPTLPALAAPVGAAHQVRPGLGLIAPPPPQTGPPTLFV